MTRKTAAIEADREIIITIPVGEPPESGYEAQKAHAGRVVLSQRAVHIDANLGEAAAIAFLRLRNGLRDRNAKLGNGRPVWSNPDALRWLMEQVAAEVV